MKIFGLIGFPLTHSFSVGYFAEKFKNENITDTHYKNFPIESIEMLQEIIMNEATLAGLNVTIPYKEKVLTYLNEIDEEAKEVGAVNTIKIDRSGEKVLLKGFNTDIYGFGHSLKPLLEAHHKQALILGTGGASKAIKYILHKLGIQYISASIEELQQNEIRYHEITRELIESHHIIINATPLGTYPNIESCPDIPYEYITAAHILYDLVYNPEVTKFLAFGKEKGAKTINGLKMLHLQADKSWQIWNE